MPTKVSGASRSVWRRTALAGSLLIAALTSSFLQGVEQNPAVPPEVADKASIELASGIPFISDADLEKALAESGATADVAQAVLESNQQARLDGLRSALAVLALFAVAALLFSRRLPTRQP